MPEQKISITFTLMLCISIGAVTAMLITPALPLIAHGFHINDNQSQLIIGIYLAGFMLGQLPYAHLSNRYGRVKALQIGLIINLLGNALCLLSAINHYFVGILLGRLLSSCGASAGLICSFTLISEYYTAHRAKVIFSFTVISFTVGEGLAVSLGGILSEYFGWISCFLFLMLYGLLVLVMTGLLPETLVKTKDPHCTQALKTGRLFIQELSNPVLVGFSIIMGIGTAIVYAYAASGPLIAFRFLKMAPAEFGVWNFMNTAAMLIAGLLSARWVTRFSGRQLIAFGIGVMSAGAIGLALLYNYQIKNPLLFFLASALLCFGPPMTFPSASAYATRAAVDKATGASVMNFNNLAVGMMSVFAIGIFPAPLFAQFLCIVCLVIAFNILFLSALRADDNHAFALPENSES